MAKPIAGCASNRSEEHTSELQSLRHLVCRLLLEKKNAKSAPCAARCRACDKRRATRRLDACQSERTRLVKRDSSEKSSTAKSGCYIFFFNDPATTEIYPLSLHDALPICWSVEVTFADHAEAIHMEVPGEPLQVGQDRKSTRLNSSHLGISYAVFCFK